MLKKYPKKWIFLFLGIVMMVIFLAMLIQIASIDTSHNIFFTNEYIIKPLCILKL